MSAASVTPAGSQTETSTHITDPKLLFTLRLFWLTVFLMVTAAAFIVIPEFYQWVVERTRNNPTLLAALQQLGISVEARAFYLASINSLSICLCLISAAVIFYLSKSNWVVVWTSLVLMMLSITPNAFSISLGVFRPDLIWLSFVLMYLGVLLLIPYVFAFPDGRFNPSWVKVLLPILAGWELLRLLWSYFIANNPRSYSAVENALPIIIVGLLAIPVQVYKHRRSSVVQKQQTKWVAFGMILLLVFFAIDFLPGYLPITPNAGINYLIRTAIHSSLHVANWIFIGCLLIGITRYRLWEVDLVINRSLVYGLVTVGLAIVFFGSVFVLHSLLGGANPLVALAVSAVIPSLLFNPTRKRAQNLVDRYIYRLRYDLNEVAAAQKMPEVKNPGLYTGRTFGKYEVLGVLGKGGMGEVYKGFGDGQTVAIKVLPTDLAQKDEFRKRFTREAKTLSDLQHPNIVKLFDSGVSDEGVHYLVMEFIDGQELSEVIQRGAINDYEALREWVSSVAAALDYIHAKGLVHRDLKPSNVMLRPSDRDSEVKEAVLMDFGIARVDATGTRITGSGAVGTIDYMSPEQIMAAREVDKRSDVYSLGIIVYELLTGERPFKGGAGQVLFAHLQQPPRDPRDVNSKVPRALAHAVLQALAKKPEERFDSAGAFAAALAAALV